MTEEHVGTPPLALVAGALSILLKMENRIGAGAGLPSDQAPWSSHWGSWRMGGADGRARRVLHTEDGLAVTCTSHRDGSFDISWRSASPGATTAAQEEKDGSEDSVAEGQEDGDAVSYHVDGSLDADGGMEMVVNGTQRIKLTTILHEEDGLQRVRMWPQGLPYDYFWKLDAVDPQSPLEVSDHLHHGGGPGGEGFVEAPMPGKISRVQHSVGDAVQVGDVVVVMEAMKMEHACASPRAGVVTELRCEVGDVVDDGAVLFVVQDPGEETSQG